MAPVDQQLPDIVVCSSSSPAKMENTTTKTSKQTDVMHLLSPTAILAQMARNTATDVNSSNEHPGLVGIAPPTWESKRRVDDSYSTDSSGTYSTQITANHRKSLSNDLLDIANPDGFMDLSNPNDDLLNVSLNLLEDFYDRRDDSSITLVSVDDVLPLSKPSHYSALHTIFSGEENDPRYESQSTAHHSSSDSSCYYKSSSGTDDDDVVVDDASEHEEQQRIRETEQSSPQSGSSGLSTPKDSFGLPLLPFSHELFQKIRARRRIVDQQLKEQEEHGSHVRDAFSHTLTAVDLVIHEEKKEEEATPEVDHLAHFWFEKLMIELKAGHPGSSTLQFPGQRTKGRTTDKDSSNQPMLPSRQENERLKHQQLTSCWILLHASSRKLMMIRSRSVPILSFFGVPSRKNSPRGVPSRNAMFKQFVEEYKKHVEESATPEELYRKRVADRKRTWSQDLIENRYYEVRSRALFQLEESKRRLYDYKRENV